MTWVLRSGDQFWSPSGWTSSRDAALRFESREKALRAAVYLESDRDCMPLLLRGPGIKETRQ